MISFQQTANGDNLDETGLEPAASTTTSDDSGQGSSFADAADHLQALGLPPTASLKDATEAHRRLVADLTPGPDASHRNVELAHKYLHEVNQAYASLRTLSAA